MNDDLFFDLNEAIEFYEKELQRFQQKRRSKGRKRQLVEQVMKPMLKKMKEQGVTKVNVAVLRNSIYNVLRKQGIEVTKDYIRNVILKVYKSRIVKEDGYLYIDIGEEHDILHG